MRSNSTTMFLGLKLMLFSIFFNLFIKDGYCRQVMALYHYPKCRKNHQRISKWLHSTAMQRQDVNLLENTENKLLLTLVKNIKFKAFDRILGRF